MAFQPLRSVVAATLRRRSGTNLDHQLVGPVVDADGAAVDFSAWSDISLDVLPAVSIFSAQYPSGANALDTVALTGDANGYITVPVNEIDGTALPGSGQFPFQIRGRETGADQQQLLATGQLSVSLT